MAISRSKKQKNLQDQNDIYTALLGLTVLILTATAVLVCVRSMELYDSIF